MNPLNLTSEQMDVINHPLDQHARVLPVMAPGVSYDEMDIGKGDQASMAWWKITFGGIDEDEKSRLLAALERYCALDTMAVGRIYERFWQMREA